MTTDSDNSPGAKGAEIRDILLEGKDAAAGEPEKATKPADEKPAQPVQADSSDPLEQALANILGEETPPETQADSSPGEPAGSESEALTLTLLAKKLDVEIKDLYDVAIPMPDEQESCTLSELKDQAIKYRRSEVDRLEWDSNQSQQQRDLATAREELQGLVSLIPADYRTPAMLEKVRDELVRVRETEARKTLDRIPEWSDIKQYKADQELMATHAEAFGFKSEELAGVIDARLVAYIRHNAKREKRIIEAGARARSLRERKHPSRTGGAKGADLKPSEIRPAAGGPAQREATATAISEVINKG